mmetsp:Transcript_94068/g.223886  ORF Transcript_94068/g.223886 Transcript_94068/m.223886 type:complete len:263 (-) Transcript_94068:4759-5547(-)
MAKFRTLPWERIIRSPSSSTSSTEGNHCVVPSARTMPHISGARSSGTFGIRAVFFQAVGLRFGVVSGVFVPVLDCGVSVAGVRSAGVVAGVIAGVMAGGADFVGPTRPRSFTVLRRWRSSSSLMSAISRRCAAPTLESTLWSFSSSIMLPDRWDQGIPARAWGTSNLYTGSHTRSTLSRGSSSSSVKPISPRNFSKFSTPFSKPNRTEPPACSGTSKPHSRPSRLSTATATMPYSLRSFVTDAFVATFFSFTLQTSFHSAPL